VPPCPVEVTVNGLADPVRHPVDHGYQIAVGVFNDRSAAAAHLDHDPAQFVHSAARAVHVDQVNGHPPDAIPEPAKGEHQPPFHTLSDGFIERQTLTVNV